MLKNIHLNKNLCDIFTLKSKFKIKNFTIQLYMFLILINHYFKRKCKSSITHNTNKINLKQLNKNNIIKYNLLEVLKL